MNIIMRISEEYCNRSGYLGINPSTLYLGQNEAVLLRREIQSLLNASLFNLGFNKTDEEYFKDSLFMGMKIYLTRDMSHLKVY